jgi:hypothetical protein
LSATKATAAFHPPQVAYLSLSHALHLVHLRCPLTSAITLISTVTASCLLSCLPLLPYLMADCQVVAPIGKGNHCILSNILAWDIGAKKPFPSAAAMVVMVVVVGHWRLGGPILWGVIVSEACPKKTLVSETKFARLVTQALARNCALKH